MRRISVGLTLCLFFITVSWMTTGCARKTKPVAPAFGEAEQAPVEVIAEAEKTRPESELGRGMHGELEEGELPIRQTELARELVFEEAGRELQTVYFDYDSAKLKTRAKAKLERAADWLKRNPKVNVRIEGHCDERGTNEYNLALGERRALSARRYLVSLGINPDRIFTISYGEEAPADPGHNEGAWAKNRRCEFNQASK